MAPKPCLRDTGGTFLPFKHFSFVHYRLLRCERIFFIYLFFFFPGEIIFPTLTCSLKATAEQYVGELISSLAVLALM